MKKEWILAGLVLALAIMVAAKYGVQLVRRFQNDREPARQQITGPATLQPFDERLSLRMPVAFGSPTELPLGRLPAEVRRKVQKMVQRTAVAGTGKAISAEFALDVVAKQQGCSAPEVGFYGIGESIPA